MELSPADKTVKQMQCKLDNMQRLTDILLGLQAAFMGHWLPTAQLSDSDRQQFSEALAELERYLRDTVRAASGPQEFS